MDVLDAVYQAGSKNLLSRRESKHLSINSAIACIRKQKLSLRENGNALDGLASILESQAEYLLEDTIDTDHRLKNAYQNVVFECQQKPNKLVRRALVNAHEPVKPLYSHTLTDASSPAGISRDETVPASDDSVESVDVQRRAGDEILSDLPPLPPSQTAPMTTMEEQILGDLDLDLDLNVEGVVIDSEPELDMGLVADASSSPLPDEAQTPENEEVEIIEPEPSVDQQTNRKRARRLAVIDRRTTRAPPPPGNFVETMPPKLQYHESRLPHLPDDVALLLDLEAIKREMRRRRLLGEDDDGFIPDDSEVIEDSQNYDAEHDELDMNLGDLEPDDIDMSLNMDEQDDNMAEPLPLLTLDSSATEATNELSAARRMLLSLKKKSLLSTIPGSRAAVFLEVLELASTETLRVEQTKAYGDITIEKIVV